MANEKNDKAPTDTDKKKRQHKATWAKDKRMGGYLVRVIGPHANRFVDREVPVVRKNDEESMELLTGIVWSGTDEETGKPVTLYKYQPKDENANDFDF